MTLVTAALIATVVRILLYLNGNQEGGYLTNAIANVGMTVIVLEVCIVLLRFFTAFNIMHIFNKFIPRRFELVTFTAIGMVITFILTNISFIGGISPIQFGNNEALTYIVNRPFEPLPLIVEYVALYILHHKFVSTNVALSLMCSSIIAVMIAVSNVTQTNKNVNKFLPESQNQFLIQ